MNDPTLNPNPIATLDLIWNTDTDTDLKPSSLPLYGSNSKFDVVVDENAKINDVDIDINVFNNTSTSTQHEIKSNNNTHGPSNKGTVSVDAVLSSTSSLKFSACLICYTAIKTYESLLPVSIPDLGSQPQVSNNVPVSSQDQDAHTQYPLEVGGNRKFVSSNQITESILHDFSKMFKISPTIYQSVDLSSLTSPLFCESCGRKMFESIRILREIERLEKDLDRLKDEIREDLLQSYCSSALGKRFHGEEDNDKELSRRDLSQSASSSSIEESNNKQKIRKAFAQCWTKSSIPIRRISPTLQEGFETRITRTRSRARNKTAANKPGGKKGGGRADVDLDPELTDLEEFDIDMNMDVTEMKSASDSNSIFCASEDDDADDSDFVGKTVSASSSTKTKKRKRKPTKRKRTRSRSHSASSTASLNSVGNNEDDDNLLTFQCEFCEQIFYKENYKIEDGTDAYVFKCEIPKCKASKPFKHFSRFQRHHASTCKSRPSYPCEHCDRRCFSEKSLKQHYRAKHADQPEPNPSSPSVSTQVKTRKPGSGPTTALSFTCEFCNHLFHRDDFRTEDGEYVFKCNLPDCKALRPFDSLARFKQHHRSNCLSRPSLPCEYCGRHCFDQKTLRNHITSQHTKEFQFTCDHCGLGLPTMGNLKRHLMTHETERNHKCPHCPKSFKKKSDLRVHAERHGERKVCEICGKAFNCQVDLNNHRFIHSTEKNFACKICNKWFKSRSYVDTHVWNVHRKARKPRQTTTPSSNPNPVPKETPLDAVSGTGSGSGSNAGDSGIRNRQLHDIHNNSDSGSANIYLNALNASLISSAPIPHPVDTQTQAMNFWNQKIQSGYGQEQS